MGNINTINNFRNISSNPLACDCDLVWLIPWSLQHDVRLKPIPKCATPFPNTSLKKFKIGTDFHCETQAPQSVLEMTPDQDQVNKVQIIITCRICLFFIIY